MTNVALMHCGAGKAPTYVSARYLKHHKYMDNEAPLNSMVNIQRAFLHYLERHNQSYVLYYFQRQLRYKNAPHIQ